MEHHTSDIIQDDRRIYFDRLRPSPVPQRPHGSRHAVPGAARAHGKPSACPGADEHAAGALQLPKQSRGSAAHSQRATGLRVLGLEFADDESKRLWDAMHAGGKNERSNRYFTISAAFIAAARVIVNVYLCKF